MTTTSILACEAEGRTGGAPRGGRIIAGAPPRLGNSAEGVGRVAAAAAAAAPGGAIGRMHTDVDAGVQRQARRVEVEARTMRKWRGRVETIRRRRGGIPPPAWRR